MDIAKISLKRAGAGIFIVLALLLSSTLSWGDTRLMVDQATNGGLTLAVWDGTSKNSASANLPGNGSNATLMSCEAPVVDWDSTLNSNSGGWAIFGSSDTNGTMWSGQVTCASYNPAVAPCTFTYSGTPPTPNCGTNFTLASSCLASTALSTTVVANPVNGVCGSSNGQTLTQTPATGLCVTSGTPGAVISTANGWSWTCPGLTGGLTASCYAYQAGPPVNGSCGSDNNGTFSTTPPSSGLCNAGTASSVSGGSSTGKWNWTCAGSNGGTAASCSANYGTNTVVNGQCGSANGQTLTSAPSGSSLCNTGTATSVSGTGPWTWGCTGSNGGTTASCTAYSSSQTGCPQATSTFVYIPGGSPASGGGLGMSVATAQTISAGGEKHYFFCLSKPPITSIQISMATEDWQTDQDMLVSNVSQPSCSQDPNTSTSNLTPKLPPWYNINPGTTEMVLMHPPANQNLVYYVTVCSQSNTTGKFGLYWAAN